MNLRKCPACKNIVSAESPECPVCGCEPRKRIIRQVITWIVLVAGTIWIAERTVLKKLQAHPKSHPHAQV